MRSPFLKRWLLCFVAGAIGGSVASAQTSSSTPTIGFYKQTFPSAGAYAVSVGLITKTDFQGQPTAAPSIVGTTMTVTQTGATWSTNQFQTSANPATTSSHYIEVLSDGNAGHVGMILDIRSNTPTTLSVEVPSGFSVPGTLRYAIRKHVTLGTALGTSSGVVASEDLVVLFDALGNSVNAAYFGGGVWKNALNASESLTDFVLYPGQGFLFLPADTRTLTIGGDEVAYVKTGATQVSMSAGIPQIIGLIDPLVSTNPADPIYSTTAVNTLANFGLSGMVADSDLAIYLANDGSLQTLNNVLRDGGTGNLTDAFAGGNLNSTPIRNGQALIFVPGGDSSFVLPQRHPTP